jgi:hypothetical protein
MKLLRSIKPLRWAMPFLMFGAVGCSKLQLPHLDKNVTIPAPGVKGGASSSASGEGGQDGSSATGFAAACEQLPGVKEMHTHSVDEYPALIAFIKKVSPLIEHDPKRIATAHALAIAMTDDDVIKALMDAKMPVVKAQFVSREREHMRRKRPGVEIDPVTDLKTMIKKVMLMEDRTPCVNAYLDHFYSNFVTALDPMGKIVFGTYERKAPPDTLMTTEPSPPDELMKSPAIEIKEHLARVSPLRLEGGARLGQWLTGLENGQRDNTFDTILIDLRSTGGNDMTVFDRIKASALKGWGTLPITIWIDRTTRGTAALTAFDFKAKRQNVQVIGVDDEDYGYGRKLIQAPTTLVDGLQPVNLVIGTELIMPPGYPARTDDYALPADRGSSESRNLAKDPVAEGLVLTLEGALDHARRWHPDPLVAAAENANQQQAGTEGPGAGLGAVPQADGAPPTPDTSSGWDVASAPVADPAVPGDEQQQQQSQAPQTPTPPAELPPDVAMGDGLLIPF